MVLILIILSTLVTTTFSLSCLKCYGEGNKRCQGPVVECPPDFKACVTTIGSDTVGGNEKTWISRNCGRMNMCSSSGSLTTDFGVKKISSSCCYTSNCSLPTPKFPEGNIDKNGVSCRGCDSERGSSCLSNPKTIQCAGEENICVLMTNITKE
ncbi:hypothetical protein GDO81_012572, partial [Engystomops pustulosus]